VLLEIVALRSKSLFINEIYGPLYRPIETKLERSIALKSTSCATVILSSSKIREFQQRIVHTRAATNVEDDRTVTIHIKSLDGRAAVRWQALKMDRPRNRQFVRLPEEAE
jgi:hypothetical protein